MPRKITVELTIDEEWFEDNVSDDLTIRDIFEDVVGVGFRIITESEDDDEQDTTVCNQ